MTRLIDADKLKKSTCDKGVCSDCEDFHKGTNVSTNCSEVRWYFLEKINEQPTVNAIPVSYIQQRIDELTELAEYELESSGGYTGKAHTQIYELRRLINYWKEERARCQPRQDRLML